MTADGHADRPAVRVIDDVGEWDGIRREWDALFDESPTAAGPLHFDWLRSWWQIYGPTYAAPRALRLFTCWRGSRLVGVLPLYANRGTRPFLGLRRISFLSTGEAEYEETCPEYMNLLAGPGEADACLAALESALGAAPWDCVDLAGVPEHSPVLSARLAVSGGQRRVVVPRDACPIANLAGGFEAYLQRLSPNSRQQGRRLLREVEQCGARFELATPAVTDDFFNDLVSLHQERWRQQGKPGCFAAPRFTAFHRALAARWVGSGQAVIARLACGGQAVAVLYGFVTRSKFDFYQSGVSMDLRGPLRSPGVAAHLLLMRELCSRGVTHYDFLLGRAQYKSQLATDSVRLFTLQIWRPTVRTMAYFAVRTVGRALRAALPSFWPVAY